VGGFRAWDSNGAELPIHRRNTNQYVVRKSRKLAKITYEVADTYDATVDTNPVYPMSGTNLEPDNALINGPMVFGYFHGFQQNPATLTFRYPAYWSVGTALEASRGEYSVENFDQLVDSPFLFGELTHEQLEVGGADIHVYAYTESRLLTAPLLIKPLHNMIDAANRFLDGLPVKRYVFLFHFRYDTGPIYGAWEHNYSSYYVIPEGSYDGIVSTVTSIAAHEFFHIVTPLNLHSEVIARFDFEKPRASQHLWLYEGTTEWASDIMQVRAGLISQKEYLERMSEKLRRAEHYDPSVSLVDLSLGSYDRFEDQYQNIYEKGALVSMLLDMRLLELSHGRMGLREVLRNLSKTYGSTRTFPEKQFFDIIVKITYPEVRDFFVRYVQGVDPLPVAEYVRLAGYSYEVEQVTGKYSTNLGKYDFGFNDGDLFVQNVDSLDTVNVRLGLRDGDILRRLVYNGREVTLVNPAIATTIGSMKVGDPFGWVVRRDTAEVLLEAYVGRTPIIERHVIQPLNAVSKEQEEFRRWWLGDQPN
jgi:predicted metalloprotease with PDZ domain